VGVLCVVGTFGPASTNRGFVRAWAACARRGEGLRWLVPTFRMATQDEADAGAEAEAVQWAKAVTRAEKALYKGYDDTSNIVRVEARLERFFNLILWEHAYVPKDWQHPRALPEDGKQTVLDDGEEHLEHDGLPRWEVLEDYIRADGNAGDTLLSQRPCITWLNSLFS
jgi:hypothetical protein